MDVRFLPQVTTPAAGPVRHQILILGPVFASTGFCITAGYGATAGFLRTILGRVSKTLNRITALVFGALAIRLVWE